MIRDTIKIEVATELNGQVRGTLHCPKCHRDIQTLSIYGHICFTCDECKEEFGPIFANKEAMDKAIEDQVFKETGAVVTERVVSDKPPFRFGN